MNLCKGSIFDDVFNALKVHNHPFRLVGEAATRWMGCYGFPNYRRCDILVRDNQLQSIVSAVTKNGNWNLDTLANYSTNLLIREADATLERPAVDESDPKRDHMYCRYLRLWTESTYRICIDDCRLIEVPDIIAWTHFLVEDQYHPAIDRTDGWWYGPNTLTRRFGTPIYNEKWPRGNSPINPTCIFIPSIPPFMDALAYQVLQYQESKPALAETSSELFDKLVKDLYLELRHHRTILEIEVKIYTGLLLQARQARFKRGWIRKPQYARWRVNGEVKSVRVDPWDPWSYPGHVRKAPYDEIRRVTSR